MNDKEAMVNEIIFCVLNSSQEQLERMKRKLPGMLEEAGIDDMTNPIIGLVNYALQVKWEKEA